VFGVRRHFSSPARFPSCPNLAARHQRDDAESKRQQQRGLATSAMHACVALDAGVRDGRRGWAWGFAAVVVVVFCRSCAGRGEPVRRRSDARRCRQAEDAAAASLGWVGSSGGHGTGCVMVGVGSIDGGACFDEQEVLFGPWGRCNAYWPAGRHDGSGAMATSSRGQHEQNHDATRQMLRLRPTRARWRCQAVVETISPHSRQPWTEGATWAAVAEVTCAAPSCQVKGVCGNHQSLM